MKRVFPDRPIIDLTDDHPIFHTVFDLPGMTKVMIPHESMIRAIHLLALQRSTMTAPGISNKT